MGLIDRNKQNRSDFEEVFNLEENDKIPENSVHSIIKNKSSDPAISLRLQSNPHVTSNGNRKNHKKIKWN